MKDFLSVEGVFDGFIDILIGEPIGRSASQLNLFFHWTICLILCITNALSKSV